MLFAIFSFIAGYCTVVLFYFRTLIKADDVILTSPLERDHLISSSSYINSNHSPNRADILEDVFAFRNIPCKRVPAIEAEIAFTRYPDAKIERIELARKISHNELLYSVKGKGWALIFEDNITVQDNRLLFFLDILSDVDYVQFGIQPQAMILGVFTFQFSRYSRGIWMSTYPLHYLSAYGIRYHAARKWIAKIESHFYDIPLDKHDHGIPKTFFLHNAETFCDFFRILILRDMSYVPVQI
jgi:hypothetical protein